MEILRLTRLLLGDVGKVTGGDAVRWYVHEIDGEGWVVYLSPRAGRSGIDAVRLAGDIAGATRDGIGVLETNPEMPVGFGYRAMDR